MDPTGTQRAPHRWTWVDVDLDAIAGNVAALVEIAAPAAVWVVVKADGYGHGDIAVARAAIDAGATGCAVALVDEGERLRASGVTLPILVLSEQPPEYADRIVSAGLTPTVYTARGVGAIAAAAVRAGTEIGLHVKVDTGMQRVGIAPDSLNELLVSIHDMRGVRLAGLCTHLALADVPAHPATTEQLAVFDRALGTSRRAGLVDDDVIVHVGNSAGALCHPAARRDVVRTGIAVYGIDPSSEAPLDRGRFRQAMRWWSRASLVKEVAAGSHISYGWRHRFECDTRVATVPVGYADGVPRRWSEVGGTVLIGGRERPVVGVVTMDQLMVDLGPDPNGDDPVSVGDEVVLIGNQGLATLSVEDWADRLGTIGYEVVCAVSARVPRRVVGSGADPS
jgi:alanine racemase